MAHEGSTYFAWIGKHGLGDPYYYRISSPMTFCEVSLESLLPSVGLGLKIAVEKSLMSTAVLVCTGFQDARHCGMSTFTPSTS